MRHLIALAAAIAVLAAPALAAAASCPANALNASTALWPAGSIPTGKTVSAPHPCGKILTCTGGLPRVFTTRQCRWE